MDFASIDLEISIHVPREGDDQYQQYPQEAYCRFQSTSPVRGTTTCIPPLLRHEMIFQSTSPVRGTTYIIQLVGP